MKTIYTEILRNKHSRTGGIILTVLLFLCLILPLFLNMDPLGQDLSNTLDSISLKHLLGTDSLGRDNFIRLLTATRQSLLISLIAALFSVLIGLMIGVASGLSGTKTDFAVMRFSDIFLAFPKFFVFILMLGFTEFSFARFIFVLAILSWMEPAKIIRSEIKAIKGSLYYQAAICQGLHPFKIFRSLLLPNIIGIVTASFALQTSSMIIIESGLSFLGLGVQPPQISLGTLLNQARSYPINNYSLILQTGFFIVITVLAFHLLGDGLRDVISKERFRK